MSEYEWIRDLIILLLVSLPINILFHKIKLPSTMGFIIAGMIIGPYSLQWITDPQSVESLAEIGVVLLLFVIGLEFSLSHVQKNWFQVVGGGAFQISFTIIATLVVSLLLNYSTPEGILFGILIALSSTAIVLKMITDQAEIDTLHGRICIGILLFQDLCVVPMMLFLPILAQAHGSTFFDVGLALLESITAVVLIFLLSRLFVPKAMGFIAETGIREHMTLFVILIILGTCWVSHALGLSLALGALIAGMILSETEYNHQIIVDILPLRDYFVGIFFISVGMLLKLNYFFDSVLWFLGLTAAAIALKALMAMLATVVLKNSFRISFIVGLRLAQVGEFSILLADQALDLGLFTEEIYQSFLIVSLLSMLVSPILIQLSVKASIKLFSGLGAPSESLAAEPEKKKLSSHVIVSGYGLGGRNLSRVLKEVHIDFLVLELNAERIKEALSNKIHAIYGDATHRDTLIRAGIKQARMIVITISDYEATAQSVRLARQLNPNIFIMVRTKYASQVEDLTSAGADQVIPEEFETSIEIFSRVLKEYRVPNHIIEQQIELIRMEGYSMFRGYSLTAESLSKFSTYLTATLTESCQIHETSWARDKSLEEIGLEKNTGTTLIAVVRNKEVQAKPPLEFHIKSGDSLILFGSHVQLAQSLRHLESGPQIL